MLYVGMDKHAGHFVPVTLTVSKGEWTRACGAMPCAPGTLRARQTSNLDVWLHPTQSLSYGPRLSNERAYRSEHHSTKRVTKRPHR